MYDAKQTMNLVTAAVIINEHDGDRGRHQ